jgi:ribosomal-protein-alanine N-acetyltransferase
MPRCRRLRSPGHAALCEVSPMGDPRAVQWGLDGVGRTWPLLGGSGHGRGSGFGGAVPDTDDVELAAAYLQRQHERARAGTGYSFAIANTHDVAVGQIGRWLRDLNQGLVSIGYWIRTSALRRGYATDAVSTLARWAWSLDEIHRLELYVEPWNEGSWRAADRAGFTREGVMRSWQAVAGERRDMFIYSLTRDTDRNPHSPDARAE